MHLQLKRLERKLQDHRPKAIPDNATHSLYLQPVDEFIRSHSYGNPAIDQELLANLVDPQDLVDEFQDNEPAQLQGKLSELFNEFDNSDIFRMELDAMSGPIDWSKFQH